MHPHTNSAPAKPSSEANSLKPQLSQQDDKVHRLQAELKEKEELMSVTSRTKKSQITNSVKAEDQPARRDDSGYEIRG
jgi:hypothetical protein